MQYELRDQPYNPILAPIAPETNVLHRKRWVMDLNQKTDTVDDNDRITPRKDKRR